MSPDCDYIRMRVAVKYIILHSKERNPTLNLISGIDPIQAPKSSPSWFQSDIPDGDPWSKTENEARGPTVRVCRL